MSIVRWDIMLGRPERKFKFKFVYSREKMSRWRQGLCPRPRWGSLQRSPDPLAVMHGLGSKSDDTFRFSHVLLPMNPAKFPHIWVEIPVSERLGRVDSDGDWPVCIIWNTIVVSPDFSKLSFIMFEWILCSWKKSSEYPLKQRKQCRCL